MMDNLIQQQRGSYNAIADVNRERLLSACRDARHFQQLAQQFGIARQTAHNIIMRDEVHRRPKDGARNRQLDDEMLIYWIGKVDRQPTVALKELNDQTRADLPNKPHVSHDGIHPTGSSSRHSNDDLVHLISLTKSNSQCQDNADHDFGVYFWEDESMTLDDLSRTATSSFVDNW